MCVAAKEKHREKSNLNCDGLFVILLNLRGHMVKRRLLERDEALCHDEPEGLWDGQEGM